MTKTTVAVSVVAALGILTVAATVARAPVLQLDSCEDDLDHLRRTASDASAAAGDARSKLDDLDDCRDDPELHDLLHSGCGSQRSDYESALSDLESNMDDLDSRLHSVQDSCGYQFTINRMSSLEAIQHRQEAAQRRLCTSLKRLTGLGVSLGRVLQMCTANSDERWCKACLGLK
jgi:chromosome segregation ATPase